MHQTLQYAASHLEPSTAWADSSGTAGDKLVELGGFLWSAGLVDQIKAALKCSRVVVFQGFYGTGKSLFAQIGGPIILQEISGGRFYEAQTFDPSHLRSVSDSFVRPSFKDGNLVWEETHLVRAMRSAASAGKGCLVIVEELNRLLHESQNAFLQFLNSPHELWLEQIGARICSETRVIVTANRNGAGVAGFVGAALDRMAVVDFALPSPIQMARMTLHAYQAEPTCGLGNGVPPRLLTLAQAERLCTLGSQISELAPAHPVSLRSMLRVVRYICNTDDAELGARLAFRELTARLNASEPTHHHLITKTRTELEMLWNVSPAFPTGRSYRR